MTSPHAVPSCPTPHSFLSFLAQTLRSPRAPVVCTTSSWSRQRSPRYPLLNGSHLLGSQRSPRSPPRDADGSRGLSAACVALVGVCGTRDGARGSACPAAQTQPLAQSATMAPSACGGAEATLGSALHPSSTATTRTLHRQRAATSKHKSFHSSSSTRAHWPPPSTEQPWRARWRW
jgi:hypothetical protein